MTNAELASELRRLLQTIETVRTGLERIGAVGMLEGTLRAGLPAILTALESAGERGTHRCRGCGGELDVPLTCDDCSVADAMRAMRGERS